MRSCLQHWPNKYIFVSLRASITRFSLVTYIIKLAIIRLVLFCNYQAPYDDNKSGKFLEIKIYNVPCWSPLVLSSLVNWGRNIYRTPLVKLHAPQRKLLCTSRTCIPCYSSFSMLDLWSKVWKKYWHFVFLGLCKRFREVSVEFAAESAPPPGRAIKNNRRGNTSPQWQI